MIVVGGVYQELCVDAGISDTFGSGGRAATALASQGGEVSLHTFVHCAAEAVVRDALEPAGIVLETLPAEAAVAFRYLHSLAKPTITPWPVPSAKAQIGVEGQSILLFGMIEGSAKVTGEVVVFDPQGSDPHHFVLSGSTATRLAVVLNVHELRRATNKDDEIDAAEHLTDEMHAEVLVVKAGAVGARVYVGGKLIGTVPPYRTERVYKIGSGDMFSAAFFYGWAKLGLDPLEAADYGSRSAARYCNTRSPTLLVPSALEAMQPLDGVPVGSIYIASPFFSLGDLWLVEETARAIEEVGGKPFSPFHEIGMGSPKHVAVADLEALKASSAVLAIASGSDPGTMFEVGYAVSIGVPVVVLAQNDRPADMTMPVGVGCAVTDDFATAVYLASWATRT